MLIPTDTTPQALHKRYALNLKRLWNKIQVLIPAPLQMLLTLEDRSSLLAVTLLFLSPFNRSITSSMIMWHPSVFISHLRCTLKTMALRVTQLLWLQYPLWPFSSFTHKHTISAWAHSGCESEAVTDTTQGDLTAHSTKGWILDHSALRNREKKKTVRLQREEWAKAVS